MRIRGLLFDVGGTLIRDDTYQFGAAADARRLERLREAFGTDLPWFARVIAATELEREEHRGTLHRQDTRDVIRELVREAGVEIGDVDAERIRAACCLPGSVLEVPRPGALEALRWAERRGLRVALVTNVLWRTGADSLRDWLERGVGDCIDAYVTSIDVGWRKPHPAMFERALAELGVTASEAVMVGNSRAADIAPAKRLGLRTVLVRSSERSASEAEPDATIDEVAALPELLETWLSEVHDSAAAE